MSESEVSKQSERISRNSKGPRYPSVLNPELGKLLTVFFARGEGSKKEPYELRPAVSIGNALPDACQIAIATKKPVHFVFNETQLLVDPDLNVSYSDSKQKEQPNAELALQTTTRVASELRQTIHGKSK
jgi:hypothetical protein